MGNKVLLIGVDTTKLSGTGISEFDSASIRKEATEALVNLRNLGFDAQWHFLDLRSNPLVALAENLQQNKYDCVMLGAGIRRRPETLSLFESILNTVHFNAPTAKISLNADVQDTVEAIKRTLKQ